MLRYLLWKEFTPPFQYWKVLGVLTDCKIFIGRQQSYKNSKDYELCWGIPIWLISRTKTQCSSLQRCGKQEKVTLNSDTVDNKPTLNVTLYG